MKHKNKYIELNQEIIDNNLLVHASPVSDIKVLEPRTNHELYATENLTQAVLCVLYEKFCLPLNAIKLQSYLYNEKVITLCSVSKEYLQDISKIDITLYLLNKSSFTQRNRYTSNISNLTFNHIKTFGYEYTTKEKMTPLYSVSFKLNEFFNYSVHNIDDSNMIVGLKLLKSQNGYLKR